MVYRCVVCARKEATHNYSGRGMVCDKCCPGCGKPADQRDILNAAFDAAMRRVK